MEQLMQEIEAYARSRRIEPATVLQYALNMSGNTWARWQAGAACTLSTAAKIREYMASNPVTPDGVLACGQQDDTQSVAAQGLEFPTPEAAE